jgi:hypothetical protein
MALMSLDFRNLLDRHNNKIDDWELKSVESEFHENLTIISGIIRERQTYEGVSKSFRTGRLERELQIVPLSATECSCIAIL